jgi:UPF0755 protein
MTMMNDESGDQSTPKDQAETASAPEPETEKASETLSAAPEQAPESVVEAKLETGEKPADVDASTVEAGEPAKVEEPKSGVGTDETSTGAETAKVEREAPKTAEPQTAETIAADQPSVAAAAGNVKADAKKPEPTPVEPSVVAKPDETPKPAETKSSEAEKKAGAFFRRTTAPAASAARQPAAPPAAPPKKKKKRRDGTLSAMSGFMSFLLVALVAGAFGVVAVLHKLKEPGPLSAEKVVYLPPRSDLPEMIAQLAREGVINSPGLMNFAVLIEGARSKLKPGEYLFRKNVSLREVIDEMVAGRQILHSLTIPEGLTTEQIVQRLRDSDMLAGDVVDMPKEGALLPETYKFPRGFPRSKLIAKMQEDHRKIVEQIWAKRAKDLPLGSPYELVTLASIVEKETGKTEERPRVAAVFVNRLRKHMRLQSDPTIVYGIVGGKGSLGRGILRSEIEKWTPYNTYTIDGLPPGPIANPGRAALEATANPAQTKDLYFVADGSGGHVFAESLSDHSRNVQNWRRIEQDQKSKTNDTDQSAPAAVPPEAPKPDKRTWAPTGRLVRFDARHDDYPVGREMAADEGASHRLGVYGPAGPAFVLGGLDDPTADAAPNLAKRRVARPYFTQDAAQPKAPPAFDAEMLAAHNVAPEPEGEEDAIGPDMMAREGADGKALPDDDSGIAAYPVAPARLAELKARAVKLGLSTGSSDYPAEALGARVSPEETRTPVQGGETALALAGAPQRLRPRAFDASEGTPLDPLRDKSWDLTTPKNVPTTASLR